MTDKQIEILKLEGAIRAVGATIENNLCSIRHLTGEASENNFRSFFMKIERVEELVTDSKKLYDELKKLKQEKLQAERSGPSL